MSTGRPVRGLEAMGAEELSLVVGVTGAALLLVDEDGVVVDANPPATALLGGGEDVVGTSVDAFVAEHAGHAALRSAYAEQPRTRPLHDNAALTVTTLDGRRRHVRIGLCPVRLDGRDLVLVVIDDLTVELEQAPALRSMVDQQQDLLRSSYALVQQRERLVEAASHELRTPLTVVTAGTELLLDRVAEMDHETARNVAQRVHRHALALRELLDDVVLAAGMGGAVTDPRPVPLDGLVDETVARWLGRRPGAEISASVQPVTAFADPTATSRALDELIDNALRHGEPPVVLAVGVEGGRPHVDVRDAGPGVPHGLLADVFTPFRRGDRVDAASPGLGIGLPLARMLAEADGGSLDVHEGAFRLRLPPDRGSGPGDAGASPGRDGAS